MVENNWVYRASCAQDRRVWIIKLTDEGKKLKAELLPKHKRNIEELLGVLNQDELMELKTLLNKLIKRGN